MVIQLFVVPDAVGRDSFLKNQGRRSFGSGTHSVAQSPMSICYRIERLIVILYPNVPLHGDAEAGAITRESNSEG
jgi:hypothetical protein